MQQITALLQKIEQLAENGLNSAIEADLAMDYTRQLYAELMEHKLNATTAAQHTATAYTPPALNNQSHGQDTAPAGQADKPHIIELSVDHPQPIVNQNTDDYELEEDDEAYPSDETDEDDAERDIRAYIGVNDKYQMISELFGNNKGAYEAMIEQLNTFDAELDALKWLQDNLYFEYSWSEDSEALMILHGIMHRFYSSN